jgi:hypothetical protein
MYLENTSTLFVTSSDICCLLFVVVVVVVTEEWGAPGYCRPNSRPFAMVLFEHYESLVKQ